MTPEIPSVPNEQENVEDLVKNLPTTDKKEEQTPQKEESKIAQLIEVSDAKEAAVDQVPSGGGSGEQPISSD